MVRPISCGDVPIGGNLRTQLRAGQSEKHIIAGLPRGGLQFFTCFAERGKNAKTILPRLVRGSAILRRSSRKNHQSPKGLRLGGSKLHSRRPSVPSGNTWRAARFAASKEARALGLLQLLQIGAGFLEPVVGR